MQKSCANSDSTRDPGQCMVTWSVYQNVLGNHKIALSISGNVRSLVHSRRDVLTFADHVEDVDLNAEQTRNQIIVRSSRSPVKDLY